MEHFDKDHNIHQRGMIVMARRQLGIEGNWVHPVHLYIEVSHRVPLLFEVGSGKSVPQDIQVRFRELPIQV